MFCDWLKPFRMYLLGACLALGVSAGTSRAADDATELRQMLDQQRKQIDELKQRLDKAEASKAAAAKAPATATPLNETAVKGIVADYLKANPGAGMPPSVQTGYATTTGFAIRSAPNPKYVNWDDECKIPFELRIRGRVQIPYYFYKVTDSRNHLTGVDTGANTAPDFSQLEVKRMRLIFEGTAFDPNLRYHIQIDGSTRGIGGIDPRQNFFGNPIGNIQGGQTDANVDHAMRLFSAYIAYDFHPCCTEKGCGPDCLPGEYRYTPTFTLIAGKAKPLFGLEEYLGSGSEQFVEFSMANWFFDAEDDNLMNLAGTQIKAMDDRLYLMAVVTNGNETQTPNLQMDHLPGFSIGGWYDFGGSWNSERSKWDLFGDCLSDIDYSCCPVVRVGAAANLVPMDRRSQYTTAELDRVRHVPGAPNAGSNLSGLLGGAGVALGTAGVGGTSGFAVDAFDSYSYDVFAAAKYRGFSLYNEWWLRNLDNFRGERVNPLTGANGNRPILYNSTIGGGNTPALFTRGGLIDFGTTVQGGYFIIPKRLELVGRYSVVRGQSGNINGNGTFVNVPSATVGVTGAGVPATIRVVNGAFRNYAEADEMAFGVNYFFKRHLLKWQTDMSFYNGGNPAANGQSAAGFIPGVDGWLLRTQIQLAF